MAINQPRLLLLAYDIADPARLQRVHRTVRDAGLPLQYSVFLILANSHELDALLQELASIIEPRADDIRVYPLPSRLCADRHGCQHLPDGLDLTRGDQLHEGLIALVGEPERD